VNRLENNITYQTAILHPQVLYFILGN
jgi:hypothetical protein